MKKILKKILDKNFSKLSAFLRIIRDEKNLNRAIFNKPLGFKFVSHSSIEKASLKKNEVILVEKLKSGATFDFYNFLFIDKNIVLNV